MAVPKDWSNTRERPVSMMPYKPSNLHSPQNRRNTLTPLPIRRENPIPAFAYLNSPKKPNEVPATPKTTPSKFTLN